MNHYSSKTVVLVFIAISLCLNPSLATDDECQSEYQHCVKTNLDASWSLWDDWEAGQLKLSYEEFDTKHIDNQYDILACDEVTLACKKNVNLILKNI